MNRVLELIKDCDIYSSEVKLRINNGSTNFKTILGGSLSILSILLILIAIVYFCKDFITRKNTIIITSETLTNEVLLPNITDYPIMLRLSDSYSHVVEGPETYYKIILGYSWAEVNKDGTQTIFKTFTDLKPCDINNKIHFPIKYRPLFQNFTDIQTYFCTNYPENYSLRGLYGDAKSFSYYVYYVRACKNDTDGVVCKDPTTLDKFLSTAYLDAKLVNFNIESFKTIPYTAISYGLRYSISNSVYRRIWLYLKTVNYTSDFGYVFEESIKHSYYTISHSASDIDIRDYNIGTVPGAFLAFTVLNHEATTSFNRSYMKAQTVLANVGGMIKGITIISYLLNIIASERLFNIHLINHLPDVKFHIYNDLEAKKKKIVVNKEFKYKEPNFPLDLDEPIKGPEPEENKISEIKEDGKFLRLANNNLAIPYRKSNARCNQSRQDNMVFNNQIIQSNQSQSQIKNLCAEEIKKENISNPIESEQVQVSKIELSDNRSKKRKSHLFDVNIKIYEREDMAMVEQYVDPKLVKDNAKIGLDLYQLYFCSFCYNKSNNIKFKYYSRSLHILKEELDIANILNKLSQFEKIKLSHLTNDQLLMFNYLFQSNNYANNVDRDAAFNDFKLAQSKILKKVIKSNFEKYMISIIKQ